jgi:agmatinase
MVRRKYAKARRENTIGVKRQGIGAENQNSEVISLYPLPETFTPFGGTEFQTPMENANIAILPLCYEKEPACGRSGSHRGPFHLLDASLTIESVDEETFVDWGTLGIHTMDPFVPMGNPQQSVMQMKQAAEGVLAQEKHLLSLGGDHAISVGPIMAVAERHPDVGVLQVDAHLDLRNEWNGNPYSHACVMRRVADDMNLPITQVGIRSFSGEEVAYIRNRDFKPFYAYEINLWDDSWIEKVIETLPEKVYMTIDLDGLDPSVVPGVSTPEPGGLSYWQLVRLIKAVGEKKQVVAADINELVKIKGTHVSEVTAAKIATKIFVHCYRHYIS